jgi:PKD repeat protein
MDFETIKIYRGNSIFRTRSGKLYAKIQKNGIRLTTDQTTPETVNFTFSFAASQTMKVDYGDGTVQELTGTALNFSHTYTQSGTYDIAVVSTDYIFDDFLTTANKITDINLFDPVTINSVLRINSEQIVNLDLQDFVFGDINIEVQDSTTLETITFDDTDKDLYLIVIINNPNLGVFSLGAGIHTVFRIIATNNNFSGFWDLSNVTISSDFGTGVGNFVVSDNALTGILHGTGNKCRYNASNNNIQGTHDLSGVEIEQYLLLENNQIEALIFNTVRQVIRGTNGLRLNSNLLTGTLDISPFFFIDELTPLYVSDNDITTLILRNEAGQTVGNFWGFSNPNLTNIVNADLLEVRSIRFEGCDLGFVPFLFRDEVIIRLNENNMTAEEVNEHLVHWDNSGKINGNVRIEGNAAPDSTSGGFDGLSAITSLEAKGWTVITS